MSDRHQIQEAASPQADLSRRGFFRAGSVASAAVAAGLSAAGLSAAAAPAKDKSHGSALDTIQIGVIGTGGRGGGAAHDTLTINSNSRLVAQTDLYPEKCHSMRKSLDRRHGE